jgi:hypothetical protein
MTGKDFTIGALSVSAAVMFTGLMVIGTLSPRPAMGIGQTATAGDYIVTTSQIDDLSELVYVLNTEAQRLVIYGINPLTGIPELVQQIDVQPLLRAGGRFDRRPAGGAAPGP